MRFGCAVLCCARCEKLEIPPMSRIRTAVHHPRQHVAGRKMFIWSGMRLRTWTTWMSWMWIWRWSSSTRTRSIEMCSAWDNGYQRMPCSSLVPASSSLSLLKSYDLIEMIVTCCHIIKVYQKKPLTKLFYLQGLILEVLQKIPRVMGVYLRLWQSLVMAGIRTSGLPELH